jgi:Putative Tad-like Flp pilus-assembly/von Willebrand factor type A domain
MRIPSRCRDGRKGSTLVLFTLMLPTMLIPLAGLGIDATMLYIVQAKLAAAVDGAALGAGRLLGTIASPSEIAGEFLTANFRTNGTMGFWGANNLQPSINVTIGTTKTVKVTATADVPLLFARIFGFPKATVSATATATRRDSRVMIVIDRSGSMTTDDGSGTHTTVIQDVINYAQALVSGYTEGVDELGLVVYDGSGVVGYPTVRPWDSTTTSTSTGGPDASFMSGSSTDMLHQIQAITANSGTGMADALSIAYIELQKAHMRDLALNGVDLRLNSILLFTDGIPSAISMFLNNPASNNYDDVIASASNCSYKDIRTNNTTQKMFGWLSVPGPPFSTSSPATAYGINLLASTDPTNSANWWMKNGGSDQAAPNPSQPFNNCTTFTDRSGDLSMTNISMIPHADMYGNDMTSTAYTNSHIVDSAGHVSSVYNGTALNRSTVTKNYHWGLAMWNAADSAGYRIRTDANRTNRPGDTQDMQIAIFAIGYDGNSGGTDDGLLRRIANDKTSTSYDPAQQTGMYAQASDQATLGAAFAQIASAMLRLAQ